jgi:hypothetical protein
MGRGKFTAAEKKRHSEAMRKAWVTRRIRAQKKQWGVQNGALVWHKNAMFRKRGRPATVRAPAKPWSGTMVRPRKDEEYMTRQRAETKARERSEDTEEYPGFNRMGGPDGRGSNTHQSRVQDDEDHGPGSLGC